MHNQDDVFGYLRCSDYRSSDDHGWTLVQVHGEMPKNSGNSPFPTVRSPHQNGFLAEFQVYLVTDIVERLRTNPKVFFLLQWGKPWDNSFPAITTLLFGPDLAWYVSCIFITGLQLRKTQTSLFAFRKIAGMSTISIVNFFH